jgi:hypothetical protein
VTREDYMQAILDTLAEIEKLDEQKKAWLSAWRETRRQFEADLKRYRAKLRGEDRQLELEVTDEV